MDRAIAPCVYCGARAGLVDVHGHRQCAACGVNTDPCCNGEQSEGVVTLRAPGSASRATRS